VKRGAARTVLALLLALGVLAAARPVQAQGQTQQKQDTTKTRQEIMRERLKALKPLVVDTAAARDSAVADSVRRDSLGATGRAQRVAATFAHDSIMTQLLALAGYSATEYKADSASFVADSNRLFLKHNAEVLREGQHVAADSTIVFDQNTSIACAHGKPTVTGAGGDAPLKADSLCYNTDKKIGIAYAMKTEMTEGASWIVYSDKSFTVGDTLYSHGGSFTDCALDPPHYHFAAREMKYIGRDIIVARDVTFNFRDVPVFWLPFFVQSTKQGRRSGILTPRFGVNDIFRQNQGYQRQISDVGFYWAMNDYMGTEVALDWRSNDFTALRGTFDYRLLSQFLAGSMTYRRYLKVEGGSDQTVAARTDWQPDERTRLAADVSYATSTRFIRERSLDPRELNQSIRSNLGLNRRFDWGTVSLSGTRDQFISDGTVNMTLPTLGVNLSSVTIGAATWTASANARRQTKSVRVDNVNKAARGRHETSASVNSSFNLGSLGLSQNATFTDFTDLLRSYPAGDTTPSLPERTERRMQWNTGINWQQRLIGTTTFTPGLSLRGEVLEGDTTGGDRVAAPTRLDFNASLRTDLYGFIAGFGPIQRIRHRVSPSFSYTYSPSPSITQRQRQVFSIGDIREQNRLSIGLNQTFEAKMKQNADSPTAAPARRDSAGGPTRRQTVQPITLLSISTDAVVYDFVQAKEGFGVQTVEIGNNIQSDLLRGLQLSFAHDLFIEQVDSVGKLAGRDFKPHLSRLTASFSLNADSWLVRTLGLGRKQRTDAQPQTRTGIGRDTVPGDSVRQQPDVASTGQQFGLIRGDRGMSTPQLGQGNWTASFNYSLFRPRTGEPGAGQENQMVTASFSMQPTAMWSLQWNTGYNFTRGEFTDHILTLTRMMHDWDAHFDFVKAQNGNFSFQFRVQLRANPDIKLDYEQRELRRPASQQ
jgi:hypothetical protein